MAISDRITSIEEHIKESYQELEGIGIDTTGVNNNLENIPKLIDGYWETLPKVTGEGTSITLDNTKEGKMKIGLKGNTSQATSILPSGYTQVDYIQSSGTQYIDTGFVPNQDTRTVLDYIDNYTQPSFILGARSTNATKQYAISDLSSGTIRSDYNNSQNDISRTIGVRYTIDKNKNITYLYQNGELITSRTSSYATFTPNLNMYLFNINNNGSLYTPGSTIIVYSCKIYNNETLVRDYIPCYRNSDNEVGLYDLVNNVFYTNAGTGTFTKGNNTSIPNPDYPQDIHVVSGDNSINVCGKNLLDNSKYNDGTYYSYSNGIIQLKAKDTRSASQVPESERITLQAGTYTIKTFHNTGYSHSIQFLTYTGDAISNISGDTGTFTLTQETTMFIKPFISLPNDATLPFDFNIQIEKGSTATTYEAYKGASYPINLGSIELCKIGDYQDSIKKSTGKNLFENVVYKNNYIIASNGTETVNALGCIWKKIKVKPNTTYTLSYSSTDYSFAQRVSEYNSSDTFIQRSTTQTSPYTFTTTSTTEYINLSGLKIDTNIMINEGTTALPYEPYGTGWYVKKEIGKVVLDGSENWSHYSVAQGHLFRSINAIIDDKNINTIVPLSNYYKGIPYSQQSSRTSGDFYLGMDNTLDILNNDITNATDFIQWLSTHNTIVYYVLATPTYTEITDSTLISQLNALAKSYASQTNISQNNNDLASVLNATALEEME